MRVDNCLANGQPKSAPRRVADPTEIVIGTHGVIVRERQAVGVLLPEVAVRMGWDPETFVCQAAAKAGIDADALDTLRIEQFESQDF